MKIIQKLLKAQSEGRKCWSFEYFPPKTEQGLENLFERIDRMYEFGPEFIDVTWGAGGSTSDLTIEICAYAAKHGGLETCMHLTCTNMPVEKIDVALEECKKQGIQNILALRGDPPRGQERWTAVEGGFEHAVDLVKYIKSKHGDFFCISVAGYPEGHTDSSSVDDDVRFLKQKVEAGADYVVTQLFYDVDVFLQWYDKCRASGITCPIVPGIMPIHTYAGWKRITTLSKTYVPPQMEKDLEAIKDDDQACKEYGIQYCINMIKKMIDHGINDFHFYTLNLEMAVQRILEGLGFVAPQEKIKPLPWKPSAGKREKENVRPIFWSNRPKTYVKRTEQWDEFPNGRWGDSRSPAFGVVGPVLALKKEQALQQWGNPVSVDDIKGIFLKYLNGEVSSLPWCETALAPETTGIIEKIKKMNGQSYLTITSQPAVNGLPSSDPKHGWGGANGYVYQKAYLEFFISPENFEKLIEKIKTKPHITYYVVDSEGNLRTNCPNDGRPTALTWGVFPGSEIIQPTIIDADSFMAWKDEAYILWSEWAGLYEKDSDSYKVLNHIHNNWLLVNIIDNDYIHGNIFEIFQ